MTSIRIAMIHNGMGAATQINRMGSPRCNSFEFNILGSFLTN